MGQLRASCRLGLPTSSYKRVRPSEPVCLCVCVCAFGFSFSRVDATLPLLRNERASFTWRQLLFTIFRVFPSFIDCCWLCALPSTLRTVLRFRHCCFLMFRFLNVRTFLVASLSQRLEQRQWQLFEATVFSLCAPCPMNKSRGESVKNTLQLMG